MRDRAGKCATMTRPSDAHARRPDRRRRHAVLRDQALRARCDSGKADGGGIRAEDGIDVLEERVADDPRWPTGAAARASASGAGPGVLEDRSETLAVRDLGQLEVARGDGPCLAAESERDVDVRRAGCGVILSALIRGQRCGDTHGRYNTHRNCQCQRRHWESTHRWQRLERQVRQ